MKVWGLFVTHSDECTYSCTRLHKLFLTEHAAEVEKTRLELLRLDLPKGLDYLKAAQKLDQDDQNTLDADLDVEEWEVNQ